MCECVYIHAYMYTSSYLNIYSASVLMNHHQDSEG